MPSISKHGFYGTKFYTKWAHLKSRCLNPLNPKYHAYGARGIRVCDNWMTFEGFHADMYDAYKSFVAQNGERSTQIDRIDAA